MDTDAAFLSVRGIPWRGHFRDQDPRSSSWHRNLIQAERVSRGHHLASPVHPTSTHKHNLRRGLDIVLLIATLILMCELGEEVTSSLPSTPEVIGNVNKRLKGLQGDRFTKTSTVLCPAKETIMGSRPNSQVLLKGTSVAFQSVTQDRDLSGLRHCEKAVSPGWNNHEKDADKC